MLPPAGARYGYTSAAQSAMVRNGYANASIPLCAPDACRQLGAVRPQRVWQTAHAGAG
jgi:hypothetical protein